MPSYPRYAMLKGLGTNKTRVRVLAYVGDDKFDVLRRDDSVVTVYRSRLIFLKAR